MYTFTKPYVLINTSTVEIERPVEVLPEDWYNINGLNFYDDATLQDLTFAGHPDKGWVGFSSYVGLSTYSYDSGWLTNSKNAMEEMCDNLGDAAQRELLTWNGNEFIPNDNFRNRLVLRAISSGINTTKTYKIPFSNGSQDLDNESIVGLVSFINDYQQECLDLVIAKKDAIGICSNITDLQAVGIAFTFPSTTYP